MLRSILGFIAFCLLQTQVLAAAPVTKGELSHSAYEIYLERPLSSESRHSWLAVHLIPKEGWHTYWKNPGDSGATPYFGWQTDEAIKIGAALYGTPEQLPVGPLMNYGYHHASTLLFPIELTDNYTGGLINFSATAEWLVCEIECVPQVVDLKITLPERLHSNEDASGVFTSARNALPDPSYWDANLTISSTSSQLLLFAERADVREITEAYFFPEEEGVLTYAGEQEWVWSDYGLELTFKRSTGTPTPETGKGLLKLTYSDGTSEAYELEPNLTVNIRETGDTPTPQLTFEMPIWQASVFALLGGLILNLMPCVFPVLSLKAFALVSANYKTAGSRRREGWAYTFGIWISFMLIVAVLIVLRSSGAAIGWGFQLQEPLFIAFLVLLMVLVSLSLVGVFHIRLGVEGAGQAYTEREGVIGSFAKGVLATLVATPCTAPLMAPAIGFALTQPMFTVFWVFSMLALGLALPFLALTYSESLARRMPKPGLWMEKLKQGLAFPMLLTAAWLLYVYDLQAGSHAALFLLISAILLSFSIWLWQQTEHVLSRAVAAAVLVTALAISISVSKTSQQSQHNTQTTEQVYSDARLQALLDKNEPVFVYFTAEWCITCKVNEQVALFTDDVQNYFQSEGITVLKGDWTNRNAEIATVLSKYGRAGVPLYLFFPAGQEEAVVLPELLTTDIVLDHIKGN